MIGYYASIQELSLLTSTINVHKNLMKFGRAIPKIYDTASGKMRQTDRQTDKHSYTHPNASYPFRRANRQCRLNSYFVCVLLLMQRTDVINKVENFRNKSFYIAHGTADGRPPLYL